MLAQGRNLRPRDEAGGRGRSSTQDKKTRTVSTCCINPGGLSLIESLSEPARGDKYPWWMRKLMDPIVLVIANPVLFVVPTSGSQQAPKYHTKGCSRSSADSPGARTLVFAGWNCRFQKASRTEGWGQGPGSVDPRFPAGLPFPVPEILEIVAFRHSGNTFQQLSRDFPAIFVGTPQREPRNSHSLLEFSECEPFSSCEFRASIARTPFFREKLKGNN